MSTVISTTDVKIVFRAGLSFIRNIQEFENRPPAPTNEDQPSAQAKPPVRDEETPVRPMSDPDIQPDVVPESPDTPAAGHASSALERGLGRREQEIMKVLWMRGSASVIEVAQSLSTALAYTTVMTTLDRLFKKGLLQREKRNRAFIYSASMTSTEVERQRAAGLVRRLFADSRERPEILLSCLVDAVDQYDPKMLDELEARIRLARAQAVEPVVDVEESR
jgi:predicted transcriptional regulator